ncbi:hypothetical protein BB559_005114 [Furculomyces boomerangus]|uniref:Uncharacterized protein n=2 Tax=Furculomyces boomerangus TaxID=61424 RepID=A0A2T9YAM7_9FUNG|nr:hypothetical protein BB559_005114 [Furculomyces boomerangus]
MDESDSQLNFLVEQKVPLNFVAEYLINAALQNKAYNPSEEDLVFIKKMAQQNPEKPVSYEDLKLMLDTIGFNTNDSQNISETTRSPQITSYPPQSNSENDQIIPSTELNQENNFTRNIETQDNVEQAVENTSNAFQETNSMASDFPETFSINNIVSDYNDSTNLENTQKTDPEWAHDVAENGIKRFGLGIKNDVVSPITRRRLSFRTEKIKSQSETDTESLIKERDNLRLELERLQKKNTISRRDLEISNHENYETQKKLQEKINQDKLQLNSLITKLEQLKDAKSTKEERVEMEEEIQRLAVKVSNSEARQRKLQKELNSQTVKVENLVQQLNAHIDEKKQLKSKLNEIISEKMKTEKNAQLILEKSKEMENKLLEVESINRKFAESQNSINHYKEQIDQLLKELEQTREAAEFSNTIYEDHKTQKHDPDPTNLPAISADSHEQMIFNSTDVRWVLDLFSRCPPNEFKLVSDCWKQLCTINGSGNGDGDSFQEDLVGELLQSDFLRILRLFLSNSNSEKNFSSLILKSKNSELVKVLKPILDGHNPNNSDNSESIPTTSLGVSTGNGLTILKQEISDIDQNRTSSSYFTNIRFMLYFIITCFLGFLYYSHYHSDYRNSAFPRTPANELDEGMPPITNYSPEFYEQTSNISNNTPKTKLPSWIHILLDQTHIF